jgi:hypothetical protein
MRWSLLVLAGLLVWGCKGNSTTGPQVVVNCQGDVVVVVKCPDGKEIVP